MSPIEELIETVRRLRAPDGCPWDQEQTHRSLAQCLIDECSELLETIDQGDMPHMREELGDVLCQVVMHAQIADDTGHFDFQDVAREINEKLVRRHPHVFGDQAGVNDSNAVLKQWDEIKAQEPNRQQSKGVFKDLPPQLPALLYAADVVKQIDKMQLEVGDALDWSVAEERAAGLSEVSVGAELLQIIAACRKAGIDPESALRRFTTAVVDQTEKDAEART